MDGFKMPRAWMGGNVLDLRSDPRWVQRGAYITNDRVTFEPASRTTQFQQPEKPKDPKKEQEDVVVEALRRIMNKQEDKPKAINLGQARPIR